MTAYFYIIHSGLKWQIKSVFTKYSLEKFYMEKHSQFDLKIKSQGAIFIGNFWEIDCLADVLKCIFTILGGEVTIKAIL